MHSKPRCTAVSTLFAVLVLTACGGGGGGGGAGASLPAAGSLDTSFGTGGIVTTPVGSSTDGAHAIALQPDGKIVVAGYSSNSFNFDFALARYHPNGSLDMTFGGDGIVTTPVGSGHDVAHAIALQPDGKIVVAGYSVIGTNADFALARYNPDGSLDATFGGGDGIVTTAVGSSNDSANAIALQPDGRIVVAGYSVGANNDFALARYNTNGSLDTSFDGDGKVTTAIGNSIDIATAIALQSDGRIVVAGYSIIGGNYDFALARYHPNGSLDTTFGGDGIVTTAVGAGHDIANAIALQPDGKIVVAGESVLGLALVRYHPDGSLDTSFDGDGKVTTAVSGSTAIALQPDGRIVVAGSSIIGASNDFALVRYNPNGSLDTTFDGDGIVTTAIGSGDDNATAVALQPDGKIVVAGSSIIGGNTDFALVRYHP